MLFMVFDFNERLILILLFTYKSQLYLDKKTHFLLENKKL